MSDESKKQTNDTDKELSDLLDSALQDFTKQPQKAAPVEEESAEIIEEVGNPEDVWSEDFIQQAASQFESNIASILGNAGQGVGTDEQMQQSFQRMAEAAQQVLSNPGEISEGSNDFASTITQTLQGLSQGTQNLQNPFGQDDILNMFTQTGEQNAFLPFMQGMMQSLLSKDVLYPSLKEILDKFPGWLEENASKISIEDKERYGKQKQLMEEVCNELASETESNSAEEKKNRFEKVLGLMQKLQDYGQPPSDLVGDVGPGMQFDPQGNPEQCVVM